MSHTHSPAGIASQKACVVYDPTTGRIHHRHRVVTFAGGREPTAEQIAADALHVLRRLPNAPVGELHAIHVEHDAFEPGKRYRVDPHRKTLVEIGS
jgi:hypothetical protein